MRGLKFSRRMGVLLEEFVETDMSLTTLDGVFNVKEMLQKLGFVSSEKVKELSYTIDDVLEENITLSPFKYWCFIEDKRFENCYRIQLLTPYCSYYKGEIFYGWTDSMNAVDNNFRSIHHDPDRVTMFLPHV